MTLEELKVVITAETASLKQELNSVKTQLNGLGTTTTNVTSKMSKSFKSVGSAISKYLSFAAIIAGLIKLGKASIEAASDLAEVQNVVDVAFGESANEINTFAQNAITQFGITEYQAKKCASTLMAMANGMGIASDAGKKMSIQLTGLSADMASFYNVSQDVAETALHSVFTGETETLKKFGIVMTEANLEAYRLAQGIQTSYREMSQAQKVALRYNYVLSSTKDAQNDFARTSGSWANQIRLLKNNFTSLASVLGQVLTKVLLPVVKVINAIISGLTSLLRIIFNVGGSDSTSNSINKATTSVGGFTDALEESADAAKELKKQTAGFDELNNLTSETASSSSLSGGGVSIGDLGELDLDSYFNELDIFEGKLDNITKAINEEFTVNAKLLKGETLSEDEVKLALLSGLGLTALGIGVMAFNPVAGVIITLTGLAKIALTLMNDGFESALEGLDTSDWIGIIGDALGVLGAALAGISILTGVPGFAIAAGVAIIIGLSLKFRQSELESGVNEGKKWIDSVNDGIASGTGSVYTTINDTIVTPTQQTLSDNLTPTKTIGEKITESYNNGVIDAGTSVSGVINDSIVKPTQQVLNEGPGIAYDSGVDVVDGFNSGLSTESNSTEKDRRSIWQKIADAFKRLFGINSPSTVFRGYGVNIIQGLQNGLSSQFSKLLTWWRKLELPSFKIKTPHLSWTTQEAGGWIARTLSALGLPTSIPKLSVSWYDVGTNYVSEDQLAMIHKGEAIVPAKYNKDPAYQPYSNSNDDILAKLDTLINVVDSKEFKAYISQNEIGKSAVSYINKQSRILGGAIV